jgi:4-amino-4-deoxy-L-arabinose transferase-like glycosyltransferase
VKRYWQEPLVWILALALALRLAGLFWGLPASDGWDDDGFAPRNFLTALALTWKPGSYFTYPPLHALLLAALTWPGIVWALLHTHSFAQKDVVAAFIQVPVATFFTVVARLVAIVLSLGIIVCVGRMAEIAAGRRAGLFAAACCALNGALTYYGQVTNLDVPCLFWCALSLLTAMQTIAGHDPRRFWRAALFAAAAIATKDQGYAVFALALPVVLALWFAVDAWPRAHLRAVWTPLLEGAFAALLLIALLDGALTNLAGFIKRLAFLTGPASQDYAAYSHDWAGRLALLADMASSYMGGIGWLGCGLALLGVGLALKRAREKSIWVAGLLPLLAMLSFTVCFNFAALRSDTRFLLPQSVFAAVYMGVALDWLLAIPRPGLQTNMRALLVMAGLFAVFQCAAVEAVLWNDPRYDAEAWMRAHIKPGDTVETYGQNAYLPRFGTGIVTRVGEGPVNRRAPQPLLAEKQDAFSKPRDPKFIVVSDWWEKNYRKAPPSGEGRVIPRVEMARLEDDDARAYLTALENGALPYHLAHQSRYASAVWPRVAIHESTGETIRIFARD